MNNVVIIKGNGGLGRQNPTLDGISGLVTTGVAVVGGLSLNTKYELKSIADLEALGVDAAYDATNTTLLHYAVSQFFRFNAGQSLFIMVGSQDNYLSDLTDPDAACSVWRLAVAAEGKIRQFAVCINPDSDYESGVDGGLDEDVLVAVANAQATYTNLYDAGMPAHIVVEGRNLNGTITDVVDLRDLSTAAENVSVAIIQDKAIANLDALYAAHADVGTVLGCIAFARVNEDIAWVKKFRLDDTNHYQAPAYSSGTLLADMPLVDQETLNARGFIGPRRFPNFPGVYLNDSHACVELASDYAYLENSRTIDKAVRAVRIALIPELGGPLAVDAGTGKLRPEVCKALEVICDNATKQMVRDSEVSGIEYYVNPDQDVLSTSELNVTATIVPTGTGRQIKVNIGFSNPFNS